jgi:hypothetical protein
MQKEETTTTIQKQPPNHSLIILLNLISTEYIFLQVSWHIYELLTLLLYHLALYQNMYLYFYLYTRTAVKTVIYNQAEGQIKVVDLMNMEEYLYKKLQNLCIVQQLWCICQDLSFEYGTNDERVWDFQCLSA